MKFSELCQRYARKMKLEGLSRHTLARHKQTQNLFLNFLKQDREIEGIGTTEIEDFLLWMQEERQLKASTVNTHLRGLKALWRWAHEQNTPPLLTNNPFARVKAMKEPESVPEFFTPAEFERLLLVAANQKGTSRLVRLRNQAILLTLYDCGLRAEELCSLRVENYCNNMVKPDYKPNLDPDDPFWQPAGVLTILANHAKGQKERRVPVSPATVQAIVIMRRGDCLL